MSSPSALDPPALSQPVELGERAITEATAKLPAPMSDEKDLLVELTHYGERSRLSCQIDFTPALDGLKVTIAPDE